MNPKKPYEEKRRTISTRLTPETLDRLERASAAEGKTKTQIIEDALKARLRAYCPIKEQTP